VYRSWHIGNGLYCILDIFFKENKLCSKWKNGIYNLDLIRRFVIFILKLLRVYYYRILKRIRDKIGRTLESEISVIFAVPKYDNDMLDAADQLAK